MRWQMVELPAPDSDLRLSARPYVVSDGLRLDVFARVTNDRTFHWRFGDGAPDSVTGIREEGRLKLDPALAMSSGRLWIHHSGSRQIGAFSAGEVGPWSPQRLYPFTAECLGTPQFHAAWDHLDVFFTANVGGEVTPVHHIVDNATGQATLDPHFGDRDVAPLGVTPARFDRGALIQPAHWGADLVVLARGQDSRLWYKKLVRPRDAPAFWGPWTMHDEHGVLTSDPFPATDHRGTTYVFARGQDSGLWYTTLGNPGGWRPAGGELPSTFMAVATSRTEIHVYVRGADNDVWDYRLIPPSRDADDPIALNLALGPMNAQTTADPGAAFYNGRFYTFVRGLDEHLWMHVS